MSIPLDSRLVEYAYEVNSETHPNTFATDQDGKLGYQIVLTFNYELLDSNKVFLDFKLVSHTSPVSPVKYTTEEIDAWLTANRYNFILADKLELAGYQPGVS